MSSVGLAEKVSLSFSKKTEIVGVILFKLKKIDFKINFNSFFKTFIVIFAFVLRHDVEVILFRGVFLFRNRMTGVRIFRNRTTRGSKIRGGGSFNFVTPAAVHRLVIASLQNIPVLQLLVFRVTDLSNQAVPDEHVSKPEFSVNDGIRLDGM